MRGFFVSLLLAVAGIAGLPARAQVPHPPLEAYGELPGIRAFAMAPDGKHVAFMARNDGKDLVLLYSLATGELKALTNVDNISARGLYFGDNKHVVLIASNTTKMVGIRGQWEDSAAFSINIKTGKQKVLLRGSDNIYPAQGGLGNIDGRYAGKSRVFMSAYSIDSRSDPPQYLYSVNLGTGAALIHEKGNSDTVGWIVDEDGTVLARIDYSNKRDFFRITTMVSGKPEIIYEDDEAEAPPFSVAGVKPDKSALIIVDEGDTEDGHSAVYELDFEGNFSDAVFARENADIESMFIDGNDVVRGVMYSGAQPEYEFYDPEIQAAVKEMTDKLPGARVTPIEASDGWKQILYHVYAGDTSGSYILQDRETGTFKIIAVSRENIPAAAIGQVVAVSYPARDGLIIPAILTWPAGTAIETRKNLPLIVMPHGGPASHDSVGFDWWAQYFANRGYVVLQPNFRGSTGYGGEFQRAGRGEWGAKMQDDVTDGVQALIAGGMVDPDRICIVGASYGGYAALAGGAFTPDLYKCVVSVAGVSDVQRMLKFEKDDNGEDHWAVDYWKKQIGDPDQDADKLWRISPINSAEAFTAPVLLLHGRDDTVVPISQSRIMNDALKRAGKDVTFFEMKGEDHWLSDGETRLEALRAMADFVETHIGQE